MAKLQGGLHGRPAGKVAGVVYGSARTRIGKAVTARELVFPSNPQTVAQQLQRHKFKEALNATRRLGSSLFEDHFNRAIGQLPGFQSMMSIILANTNASEEFTPPPDTPLGNLHAPSTFVADGTGAAGGDYSIAFNTDTGINGTNADEAVVFAIKKDAEADYTRLANVPTITTVRSDGTDTYNFPEASTEIVVALFFLGAGAADGLISACQWTTATTHA